MASNSRVTLTEVKKYSENRSVQKQKQIVVIQPEDFNEIETRSGLQNGCSENFEKTSRKKSMIICIFLFYQQNHSAKDVLFAIFFNILEHLRTAASGIIRDSSLNSEWRLVEGAIRPPYQILLSQFPYQFFPFNFYKRRDYPTKLYDFQFLTLLPHWCKISSSYLVPVPNY